MTALVIMCRQIHLLRQVLLVMAAKDSKGTVLPLAKGQTLPEWTGNYAGQPGRYFAQILRDKWTDESPTVAFWREISLVEDTRGFFCYRLQQLQFPITRRQKRDGYPSNWSTVGAYQQLAQ